MPTDEERTRSRDERGLGANDVPPSGEEARAQGRETSMPLVWLALGLAVAALFVILLATRFPHQLSPRATDAGPPAASAVSGSATVVKSSTPPSLNQ